MRVPGIGGFSPVDNVSWVRATSPSELVYQERARPPAIARVTAPPATATSASAANEVRAYLHDAVHQLRQATETLASGAHANDTAPPVPSADDTIADTYPGVRGGTITVNGHSISVSPGVTTLREVVAALDTIPGLFAAVDTATGTIVVAGIMADKKLDITDSTGLLHALGLQTGVISPTTAASTFTDSGLAEGGPTDRRVGAIGAALERVNHAMQKLAEGPRELDKLRVAANGVVTGAVGSAEGVTAQAFRVESSKGALRIAVNGDRLANALRVDPHAVGHMLREQLAKPLQSALEQSDDAGAAAHATSLVTNKGALALPLPPVELFETILDDATRRDT
jgi:hypothetical protein